VSGLERGRDFRLGYSPERINPGDKERTIDKMAMIAGEDEEVVGQLEQIYGSITSSGTFRAASIKTAEAAKAIENAQRDINIAFMNEVTQIFAKAGVSIWDVLEASKTKWNFLPFEPGLVGGHCIGVDPYYLSHLSSFYQPGLFVPSDPRQPSPPILSSTAPPTRSFAAADTMQAGRCR
jgi:UDP-N-acetyl-D-galactosamine dehydrogenase